ncbi:MAG: hypothetical protein RLZZ20_2540, partial [Pseudomonadota bacterium]
MPDRALGNYNIRMLIRDCLFKLVAALLLS